MTPSSAMRAAAQALIFAGSILASSASIAASTTRLGGFDHGLFPGLGHLLAPADAPWPGPAARRRPAQSALLDLATVTPDVSVPAPKLSAGQRRDLHRQLATVLPHYDQLFTRAAQTYHLPAALLAAIAYTESKWQPRATHRGVAGMMMLSTTAAHAVGVSNRLSAGQSVRGGAQYLARLRALISTAVPLPDRNYFALAAYNMGIGHLQDAQTLARQLGKNPHVWADLKQVIPLLAEHRYYSGLHHGYARGSAVVDYIERVRGYQAVIAPHLD